MPINNRIKIITFSIYLVVATVVFAFLFIFLQKVIENSKDMIEQIKSAADSGSIPTNIYTSMYDKFNSTNIFALVGLVLSCISFAPLAIYLPVRIVMELVDGLKNKNPKNSNQKANNLSVKPVQSINVASKKPDNTFVDKKGIINKVDLDDNTMTVPSVNGKTLDDFLKEINSNAVTSNIVSIQKDEIKDFSEKKIDDESDLDLQKLKMKDDSNVEEIDKNEDANLNDIDKDEKTL